MGKRLPAFPPEMNFKEELRVGLKTTTAQETEALAAKLSKILPPDSVLALHGDLGAGKTTLVRGLARAWNIAEPVTSPTFNLYTIYKGTRQLIHLDAYRLKDGTDLDSLMIDDFMQSPWCFAIEWPERIEDALPEDAWHLELSITDQEEHLIRLRS